MNIILVIALLLSGGVSVAAEGSLPGSILYPVKVGVNENVRSWVAVSSEAQANWDARRADRRLMEAEELAVSGKLDVDLRSNIEARFEKHAEAFKSMIAKLEAKGKATAAVEATSEFEASLNAHVQVLSRIAAERAAVREQANMILAKVRAETTAITALRVDAQSRVSVEAGVDIQAQAEASLKAVEGKIAEIRSQLEKAGTSISATASSTVQARLSTAMDSIARGEANMSANAHAEAFVNFQEALRLAQEAQLILSTDGIFKIEVNAGSEAGANSSGSVNTDVNTNTDAGASGGGASADGEVRVEVGI